MGSEVRTVTLFAGAGGADIGLAAAGFHHLACVEGDAHACATLRAAGFPAVHAWIGDSQPERRARGKILPPLPTWTHDGAPVDLLWASPPCQPYSRAGAQMGAEDARDGWPATLAAVRESRPRWVIVENVVGAPVEAWADALRPLYAWVAVWRADAVDWGLPSHRDRLYVVAGPRPIEWPRPTHYGPRVPWLLRGGKRPWVSFGEALGLVGAMRAADHSGLPIAKRREIDITHRPSLIISARYEGLLCGAPYVVSGQRRRPLTPAECAILCGFPTGYPFSGPKSAQYRQIGNCVAPVMAEVIARAILEADHA